MKHSIYVGPPKGTAKRLAHLLPDDVPRYVRVYDNGGETMDRYTIVFTSKRGGFYVAASANPQGIYTHADGRPDAGLTHDGKRFLRPPAVGRRNHLGRRIPVTQLPSSLQYEIVKEYCELWDIPFPNSGYVQIFTVTGPMRRVRE